VNRSAYFLFFTSLQKSVDDLSFRPMKCLAASRFGYAEFVGDVRQRHLARRLVLSESVCHFDDFALFFGENISVVSEVSEVLYVVFYAYGVEG